MRKYEQLIRQVTSETQAHAHWQQRAQAADRALRDMSREFEKMKARALAAEAELQSLRRSA